MSRIGASGVEELLATGGESGKWSPFAVQLGHDPHDVAAIRSGECGVQDEGSQLVALCLAHAQIVGSDTSWLDLCSGPGGKAALLKYLAHERGARLTAVELQSHRATLVESALSPLSGQHTVVTADGRDSQFATGSFDRVLVDAPGTGLGVLRRRAESRWRRNASDVAELAKLQRELLKNALAALATPARHRRDVSRFAYS